MALRLLGLYGRAGRSRRCIISRFLCLTNAHPLFTQIKYYLEARGGNRQAVRAKLEHVRDALGSEWLRAEENGLEKPE